MAPVSAAVSQEGVARPGKDKVMIGVTIPAKIDAIIRDRAGPISLSQSAFLAAIAQHWVTAGCPPVTEADRAMQHMKAMEAQLEKPGKAPRKTA